ncbi:RcpC/CpaB family pilus assembly protein [Zhihengliuella flava]|uniref:Flp pilus assembly protein CpaB n=1 Tax=Zhihengliuella flava TaxID=1285193 RepID=A0A931DBE4_9MICC|nr:RcpC/CpaB family pilus assembly protein [Zhihengliuella flava]MBG6085483.1 Flp pilus assembly protein CpaB [Zhihengliuella flava]
MGQRRTPATDPRAGGGDQRQERRDGGPPTPRQPRLRSSRSRSGSVRYRRTWRDVAAKYRRPLAAALAAVAVACALNAVAPERADTLRITVAARDLPAGHVLGAQDLDVAEVLAHALPPAVRAAARDGGGADPLTGQLAIAAPAGTPLHQGLLVGEHLLAGTEPGTVAVPVQPVDTQTVELLSPGQHVDVVLTEGNGYEQPVASSRVATGLTVLWVPSAESAGGALTSTAGPQETVVVAATSAEAEALTAAAGRGTLHVLLVAAPGASAS